MKQVELINLLNRVKKSFEPMPIVGDLKAIRQSFAQARVSEKEKDITAKLVQQNERKNRKLYKDICKAIDSIKQEINGTKQTSDRKN